LFYNSPNDVYKQVFTRVKCANLCKKLVKSGGYKQEAEYIGKPTTFRAVANANGCNKIGIIIPCHRVIASDGSLGGYGGGLE
jgi:O-6-methylguanine DNA methyltransferase